MKADMNKQVIEELLSQTENFSTIQVMEFITERFGSGIVFSTGFGQEDQIITDIIFTKKLPVSVFTLDTGRIFQETYRVWDKTIEKYKEPIKAFFPEKKDVEQMISCKGPFSFYESVDNRKECCDIRKVAPLKQALHGAKCWVTGIRAEQSPSRKNIKTFEWDEQHQVVKCNPLIHWTTNEVIDYIEKNKVPYNSLHDKGFISIGCEPCTRAVKEGEDIRSGRWWWENGSKKECGLHR
jgi:phosphoadenosine phosphosulfate reductase